MTQSQAEKAWQIYAQLAVSHPNQMIENPAAAFAADTKAHKFDEWSEEEYYDRLDEVREISSALWDGQERRAAADIFRNLMGKTNFQSDQMDELLKVLGKATSSTDFKNSDRPAKFDNYTSLHRNGRILSWKDQELLNPSPDPGCIADMTPHQIYELLDREIYSQEEAKRAAAMVVYNHSRRVNASRRNIVMAGPTGCGKTEIWRVLQRYYPRIEIIDAPRLASDGWRGSLHLYDAFDRDDPDPGNVILVLDEMDKALTPRIASGGTDTSRMIQNELLKIMDGDVVTYNKDDRNNSRKIVADCSRTSVVFCGSFADMLDSKKQYDRKPIGFSDQDGAVADPEESLYTVEDLVTYGNMRNEIAGRINQIVALSPMTQDDYRRMLDLDSSKSPLVRLSDSTHKHLMLNDNTREELAKDAARTGLGVRYLRSWLQRRLDEQVFDFPDEDEYDLSS